MILAACTLLWALNGSAQTESSLDKAFDRAGVHAPLPSVEADERDSLPKPKQQERQAAAQTPPLPETPPPASAKPAPLPPGEVEKLSDNLELISRRLLLAKEGNPERDDLQAALTKLSRLVDEDKVRFVQTINDPASIFVPIALSRVPHSFEVHMMADRLNKLLKEQGLDLGAWMQANDAEKWAGLFYLRLSAYDRLGPYLARHPEEAVPVLEAVFKGVGSVQENAPAIQALMEQVTRNKAHPELGEALARGAIAALDDLPKDRAKQLALLMMLYQDRFGGMKDAVVARASQLVPEGSYLSEGEEPRYDLWPEDGFKAAFHFADARDYQRCLAYFLKHGFSASEQQDDGVVLSESVNGHPVTLVWKLYKSDDDGFMDKAEAGRFQDAIHADLKNPDVQAVFLRSHPDFSYTRMFRSGADTGKIFFDGSCRGVWAFSRLEHYCPDCMLIGNAGGGDSNVNDGASYQLIEGLARMESLDTLRGRLAKTGQLPRFLGPWNPPYYKALRKLK